MLLLVDDEANILAALKRLIRRDGYEVLTANSGAEGLELLDRNQVDVIVPDYKFLTKPWDDAQLRAHIEEAFQHKDMADDNRRLNLEVHTANHGLAKASRRLEELLKQKQQQIRRYECDTHHG